MAGMLGAVRCKSSSSDVTFIVAYALVEPGGAERIATLRGCRRLWDELESLIYELPSHRTSLDA
eukprot:3237055-Pyramimonas_sp.AAC.1